MSNQELPRSVAEKTSTGDTAADELKRPDVTELGTMQPIGSTNATPEDLVKATREIPDQDMLNSLTNYIMRRDPGEYADPENRNHALFLAADLMRNFNIAPKA
jgi:hypothetical protein